jgi:hypothetical protein
MTVEREESGKEGEWLVYLLTGGAQVSRVVFSHLGIGSGKKDLPTALSGALVGF